MLRRAVIDTKIKRNGHLIHSYNELTALYCSLWLLLMTPSCLVCEAAKPMPSYQKGKNIYRGTNGSTSAKNGNIVPD